MPFPIYYFIREDNLLLQSLLILIIVDYITGILKSIYTKTLSSKIGAKGIIKKVGYILIALVSYIIDYIVNSNIKDIIIYMFIANEGISILENWSQMGIKIPNILKDKFNNINKE